MLLVRFENINCYILRKKKICYILRIFLGPLSIRFFPFLSLERPRRTYKILKVFPSSSFTGDLHWSTE